MLEEAGVEHHIEPAQVDDGELVPGGSANAHHWVAALAYLKAISASRTFEHKLINHESTQQMVIIGADTVCVQSGQIIGQPVDRDHARAMIQEMSGSTHEVLTGIAILDPSGQRRDLFVDRSQVTVGEISDDEIEAYLDSELWRGKAGGYNITERLKAGWPIEFDGDESSIVGLPLARVIDRVRSFYLD